MDRVCVVCGASFEAPTARAKYCSRTCSSRASRGVATRKAVTEGESAPITEGETTQVSILTPPPPDLGPVESALLAELTEVERESSSLGRAALALAHRVDEGRDLGSALAALVKQLEATKNAATADVKSAASPLDLMRDELAERRSRGA